MNPLHHQRRLRPTLISRFIMRVVITSIFYNVTQPPIKVTLKLIPTSTIGLLEGRSVKFQLACKLLPGFCTDLIREKPHARTFTSSLVATLLREMRSQMIAFNGLRSKKCKREFSLISKVRVSFIQMLVSH